MKAQLLLAAPLALACSLACFAQEAPRPSPWTETRFHRVHLRNGNFLDGDLVKQNSKTVILNMKPLGEFAVARDMILRLEYVKMRSIKEAPVIIAASDAPGPSIPKSVPTGERPDKAARPAADPSARRPSLTQLGGAERFPAEIRKSVDGILVGHSLARSDIRTPIAPRIQALGADAMAYACWVARATPAGIEMPDLIQAVSEFEHPEVQPTLLALAVSAPDSFDRAAAVKGLAKRGTPEALEAVHRAVGDPSGQVWRVASEEVAKLAEAGRADAGLLIEILNKAKDKGVVARLLAKMGGEEAIEAIRSLLSDSGPKEKVALLQALGASGTAEDMSFAHDLLDNSEMSIRKETCIFLGKVRNRASVRKLMDMLNDTEASVADSALWSLRKITGQTYDKTPETWERWWTLSGQKSFGVPEEK